MDQYTTTPTQVQPRNGLGTAGLVLGIIAATVGFIPVLGLLSFLVGPLAVILGAVGWSRTRGARPVADNPTASMCGVGLGVLGFVFAIAMAATMNALVDEAGAELPGVAPVAEQPAPQPAEVEPGVIPEGTHVVGVDIEPGSYRTAGPTNDYGMPCYWARLSDTSGSFESIVANGNPTGPTTVTVEAGDGAFQTTGCAPWAVAG